MHRQLNSVAVVCAAAVIAVSMIFFPAVEQADARSRGSNLKTHGISKAPPKVVRDHGTGNHGTVTVTPSKPGGKATPQTQPPKTICYGHGSRGCKMIIRDHRPPTKPK
jgi:hypothetical protein